MSSGRHGLAFSISDALLPLLDVAILLLGLLMILWTVHAANIKQDSQDAARPAESLLPSQVELLTVQSSGQFQYGGELLDKAALEDRMEQGSRLESDRLILIVVEDPWSEDCNDAYEVALSLIRRNELTYALFSR